MRNAAKGGIHLAPVVAIPLASISQGTAGEPAISGNAVRAAIADPFITASNVL
jgi:hypothetical protein